MNGIINIYKEKGFTSHDVVAKMRGILRTKKIGHTGTLDPEAEGVLPVCVGLATKLCETFTDHDKEYRCTIRLGIATDTEDMTGTVTQTSDMTEITEEAFWAAAQTFVGTYMQIPPMYSAIKVNGRKLYELAREGKVIEREPRKVTIFSITPVICENNSDMEYTFLVHCSKGTYIRSLCRDIGEKLGGCACMKQLVRTRMGNFDLKEALTLTELEEIVRPVRGQGDGAMAEALGSHLLGFEDIFRDAPRAVVTENGNRYLMNGNPLAAGDFTQESRSQVDYVYHTPDSLLCVFGSDGWLTGLYRKKEGRNDGRLYPYKMLIGE